MKKRSLKSRLVGDQFDVGKVLAAVAAVGLLGALLVSTPIQGTTSTGYSFNWAGAPAHPQPWDYRNQGNFDVIVHTRDQGNNQSISALSAQHGPNCEGFQPTLATHPVSSVPDAVFMCNNHMMTAINEESYGAIYVTPPVMVDFSQSATVTIDMSTFRQSNRDWVDFWLTPFSENLTLPLSVGYSAVDLNGPPKDGIRVEMSSYNDGTTFRAYSITNFAETELNDNWWTTLDTLMNLSANLRTTFQINLTPTHIRFGIPALNFWYVDSAMKVNFTQAVLQIGHHSYNPTKSDGCGPSVGATACAPNTWHWSNLAISNAVPFTIDQGSPSFIGNNGTVALAQPAPAGGFLRFAAQSAGNSVNVSFDGGPYLAATVAQESMHKGQGNSYGGWDSFWTPIPAGTKTITFKGINPCCSLEFSARDITVWSLSSPGSASPPNPVPTPSTVPTPSPASIPKPGPSPASPVIPIEGIPCTVTIDGTSQPGTCSGTFQPS